MTDFQIGDPVHKRSGYKWPGRVVAKFETLDGHCRYVVECTVAEVRGALHIYAGDQMQNRYDVHTPEMEAERQRLINEMNEFGC